MNRSIEANEGPISPPDRSASPSARVAAVDRGACPGRCAPVRHHRPHPADARPGGLRRENVGGLGGIHPGPPERQAGGTHPSQPISRPSIRRRCLRAPRATSRAGLADIGDSVTEGQLLAEIVAPDLDQELAQAQHQLQQAQANYEIARVTAVRWEQLWQKQVVSKEENDTDQAAYNAAEATMNADKANVARLVALEAFKNVTAPFAGRITARLIDIGTLVSAGSGSAGTTLYQIAQTNPLNIFVNVPQSNAPDIHEGLAAKLLVNEYPNRDFEARVTRTAAALDPASRTLNTELQIPNDDGALYAGMYAYVKFTLSGGNGPIILPANAFVFKTEGPQVATLTKDGRIHWQKSRSAAILAPRWKCFPGWRTEPPWS